MSYAEQEALTPNLLSRIKTLELENTELKAALKDLMEAHRAIFHRFPFNSAFIAGNDVFVKAWQKAEQALK